jgi:drug/metabolite transporter (DMT)-like permease
LLWLLITKGLVNTPSFYTVKNIIILSLLSAAGLYCFIKANQLINFSTVIIINIAGTINQQLMAHFILDETISNSVFYSLPLVFIGHFFLLKSKYSRKGILYAIVSSISWSTSYSLLSIPLKNTTAAWGTLILEASILEIFTAFSFFIKTPKSVTSTKYNNSLIALIGLLTVLGGGLFNYAYKHFSVSSISLLSTCFYPLSILASSIYFKEPISRLNWIGNILIFSGILIYLIN